MKSALRLAFLLIFCIVCSQGSAFANSPTLQDGLAAFERQDYSVAFPIIRRKALDGDQTAQDVFAYMFENGWGTPVDANRAVFWYRKAAMQGTPPSETSLGRMYEEGFGVEKNLSYAAWWFTRAADHNYPGARERLNNLLRAGVRPATPPEFTGGAEDAVPYQAGTTEDAAPKPVVTPARSLKGAKPVWPAGMEAGNLYFVTSDEREEYNAAPVMVAALSADEAVNRLQEAEESYLRTNGIDRPAEHYKLVEGGECTGPVWGAVARYVVNKQNTWGGSCGKTPAEAIENAYAACAQKGGDCRSSEDPDMSDLGEVEVALSGKTSWSGTYCGTCYPGLQSSFGSFNAFISAGYNLTIRVADVQEALSTFGKPCIVGQMCFYTSVTLKCHFNVEPDVRTEQCSEPRFRRDGYSGPLRNP